MDYTLLCAYTPDCDGPALDLVTDWCTWVFFFDDEFLEQFKHSRDLPSARAYIDGLERFLRDTGGDAPEPGNAAETGLRDLWARTVPHMSPDWRRRFVLFMPLDATPMPEPLTPLERGLADLWRRSAGPMDAEGRRRFRAAVRAMTESRVWEVGNEIARRVPDPVDYVEMRRRTFGSDLTMSLARVAYAGVIPDELYGTRVLHEMQTAAQDYAAFANDLYSYQKEVEFEGELHNLVVVVQRFLEVDRRRAAEIVDCLMTARMRQFERLTTVDLPAMCDELDLAPPVREALSRRVAELKELMRLRAERAARAHRIGPAWAPRTLARRPAGPPPAAGRVDRCE